MTQLASATAVPPPPSPRTIPTIPTTTNPSSTIPGRLEGTPTPSRAVSATNDSERGRSACR